MSIIGLPITFLMALTPPVFFFLLCVRLAMFVLPFRGGWVAAAGVAVLVFVGVPWVINQRLDATAQALVAGDVNSTAKPFEPRSLAVLSAQSFFGRDQTPCDDFCLRALLSGALDRVVVATEKDPTAPLDLAADAVSFRMERRDSCPAVNLQSAVNALKMDRAATPDRPVDAAEMMRLRIAAGDCLVQEPAQVGDADAVARVGRVKQGETPYDAGLDPFADTVRADRISLWQRGGDGFAERYRWTGVEVHRLLPVLMPSYVTGYGLEIANGFIRVTDHINIADKYYQGPDRTAFFTQTLGLTLALDPAGVDQLRTAALSQRLDTPGELDPIAPQIAEDFFHDIAIKRTMTATEAEQGLRIVADGRLPVPRAVFALARYADSAPEDIRKRTGEVLVSRLLTLDRPVARTERSRWEEQASALGSAIRALPAQAAAMHRPALERVARLEALRVPAWQSLVRLADVGGDAVPTFLYLIEDAERFRTKGGNDWQHPYLAGLIGICTLGADGRTALEPLYARVDRALMPMHGSYGELMVNTLLSIGGDPDAIWTRVQATDPKADRVRFDRIAKRARKEPDCSY